MMVSCTGHLYAQGDYEAATAITRSLIENPAKRTQMAAAARTETETLGWMAAIRRVRDLQYQRAINTFRAHKRYLQHLLECLIVRSGTM